VATFLCAGKGETRPKRGGPMLERIWRRAKRAKMGDFREIDGGRGRNKHEPGKRAKENPNCSDLSNGWGKNLLNLTQMLVRGQKIV
jgi:hypothetical protein